MDWDLERTVARISSVVHDLLGLPAAADEGGTKLDGVLQATIPPRGAANGVLYGCLCRRARLFRNVDLERCVAGYSLYPTEFP